MMNRIMAYVALVLMTVLAACSNKSPEQAAERKNCVPEPGMEVGLKSQIAGTWNWIETAYFSKQYGQLTKTPQNTGKKLTYTFTDDTLIITSDGKVVDEIRYEIGALKDLTHFPQDITPIIRLYHEDDNHRISLLHFCDDEIVLMNSYNSMGGNVTLRRDG